VLVLTLYSSCGFVLANSPQEEPLEAIVTRVVEEKQIEVMQKKQLYQKLELTVMSGQKENKKIIVAYMTNSTAV